MSDSAIQTKDTVKPVKLMIVFALPLHEENMQ